MQYGFATEDPIKGQAALIIYAIYKSRDKNRGPSGLDMWGKIERYARSSAKRATGVDEFTSMFKRKMACSTINPYWLREDTHAANARRMSDGSIVVLGDDQQRSFGLDVFEPDEETGKEVVECIYTKTQLIILLVRDRLEREKPFEKEEDENED